MASMNTSRPRLLNLILQQLALGSQRTIVWNPTLPNEGNRVQTWAQVLTLYNQLSRLGDVLIKLETNSDNAQTIFEIPAGTYSLPKAILLGENFGVDYVKEIPSSDPTSFMRAVLRPLAGATISDLLGMSDLYIDLVNQDGFIRPLFADNKQFRRTMYFENLAFNQSVPFYLVNIQDSLSIPNGNYLFYFDNIQQAKTIATTPYLYKDERTATGSVNLLVSVNNTYVDFEMLWNDLIAATVFNFNDCIIQKNTDLNNGVLQIGRGCTIYLDAEFINNAISGSGSVNTGIVSGVTNYFLTAGLNTISNLNFIYNEKDIFFNLSFSYDGVPTDDMILNGSLLPQSWFSRGATNETLSLIISGTPSISPVTLTAISNDVTIDEIFIVVNKIKT